MHIPDGFLPPSVCITGYALTGGVTWYCLRQIQRDREIQANIPKASLLTAAFFVASLVHIPIPPTSIHLIFNGLMGAILGYYAFPAILIGLLIVLATTLLTIFWPQKVISKILSRCHSSAHGGNKYTGIVSVLSLNFLLFVGINVCYILVYLNMNDQEIVTAL